MYPISNLALKALTVRSPSHDSTRFKATPQAQPLVHYAAAACTGRLAVAPQAAARQLRLGGSEAQRISIRGAAAVGQRRGAVFSSVRWQGDISVTAAGGPRCEPNDSPKLWLGGA